MEFASCKRCNEGTRAADLVASFFSRLSRAGDMAIVEEAIARKPKMKQLAPGVLDELFRPDKEEQQWIREHGVLKPFIALHADGPITKAYLTVFAAKLGMALYRKHVGSALPVADGSGVYTQWFLNAGLAQTAADRMMKILPLHSTLRQGSFVVSEQFIYHYNCDQKSIVAALASFHSNLFAVVVATSKPEVFKISTKGETSDFVESGLLLEKMPNAGKPGAAPALRFPASSVTRN